MDLLSVFLIVMCIVATAILMMAVVEFIGGLRAKRQIAEKSRNVEFHIHADGVLPTAKQPEPVPAPAPAPVQVAEPAPVVEEVKEEPAKEEGKAVILSTVRETLVEEYAKLSKKDKALFDKIKKEIASLEKVRMIDSKFRVTAMQGQDKVATLEIVHGEIRLNCFLVDSELKAYGKENGSKIKPTKVKLKFADSKDYEAAQFALKVANKKALEARGLTPTEE